jgi:hypothetical protein
MKFNIKSDFAQWCIQNVSFDEILALLCLGQVTQLVGVSPNGTTLTFSPDGTLIITFSTCNAGITNRAEFTFHLKPSDISAHFATRSAFLAICDQMAAIPANLPFKSAIRGVCEFVYNAFCEELTSVGPVEFQVAADAAPVCALASSPFIMFRKVCTITAADMSDNLYRELSKSDLNRLAAYC